MVTSQDFYSISVLYENRLESILSLWLFSNSLYVTRKSLFWNLKQSPLQLEKAKEHNTFQTQKKQTFHLLGIATIYEIYSVIIDTVFPHFRRNWGLVSNAFAQGESFDAQTNKGWNAVGNAVDQKFLRDILAFSKRLLQIVPRYKTYSKGSSPTQDVSTCYSNTFPSTSTRSQLILISYVNCNWIRISTLKTIRGETSVFKNCSIFAYLTYLFDHDLISWRRVLSN